MFYFNLNTVPPEPRPPAEIPPNEPAAPETDQPSTPMELPPETDPTPSGNPPLEMRAHFTREIGGRTEAISHGLEETRFGDWESNGKCVDF